MLRFPSKHLTIIFIQLLLTIGCSECYNADDMDSIFGHLLELEEKAFNPKELEASDSPTQYPEFNELHNYFKEASEKQERIDLTKVQKLVEQKRVDLSAKVYLGRNILHEALNAKSDLAVITYLIEQLEAKYPGKVKQMLNEKDKEHKTPFIYAISCFDINILKFLVAHGTEPTEKEVHIALQNIVEINNLNNLKIFEYLLSLNNLSIHSCTSLLNKMKANKSYSFLEPLLIKLGERFQVNNRDKEGNTLLHNLILSNDEKIVRVLIEKWRPDLNSRNSEGKTPLILAIENSSLPIVNTLLRENVDLTLRDRSGKLPLEIAIQKLEKQKADNQDITHNPAQAAIVIRLNHKLKQRNPSNR